MRPRGELEVDLALDQSRIERVGLSPPQPLAHVGGPTSMRNVYVPVTCPSPANGPLLVRAAHPYADTPGGHGPRIRVEPQTCVHVQRASCPLRFSVGSHCRRPGEERQTDEHCASTKCSSHGSRLSHFPGTRQAPVVRARRVALASRGSSWTRPTQGTSAVHRRTSADRKLMSSTVSLNGWSPGELVLWVLILNDLFIIDFVLGELADDPGVLDGHRATRWSASLQRFMACPRSVAPVGREACTCSPPGSRGNTSAGGRPPFDCPVHLPGLA